jgi:cell wall-associated NlpC family hydrolase
MGPPDRGRQMTGRRGRILRLCGAVVFALSVFLGSVATSQAAPTKGQVEAAKAKLAALQQKISGLVEQYDQAKIAYQETQQKLAEVRKTKAQADAEAKAAIDELSKRAVAAYTGMGSQLDSLLGSSNFSELSDRVQYMGALAQSDEDLAARADAASAQAQWAAQELERVQEQQRQQQASLQNQIAQIKQAAADQQALYQRLNRDYQAALRAERQAEQQAALDLSGTGGPPASGGGGGGGFVPDPDASAAETAIAAAMSVQGAPYVWGAADPDVGFDCSGLTMWAYAQAGVSLPHSSTAQSSMFTHLSRDQLQRGDLLFFYTPVSHVSIYLGGNSMISASHPGPGGGVAVRSVFWDSFDWGGRPT